MTRGDSVRWWSWLLIAPFLLAGSAGAQQPDVVGRVVEGLAAAVEQRYVFPDTGRMVADHLRARLRAGAYAVSDMSQLADRLSADMKAIIGDLHLYVNYAPGAEAATGGPQMVMRRPGDQVPPGQALQQRRANFEIERVERLAGNVGYLLIHLLSARGNDEMYRVIDAAMSLLGRTDAMILDVRRAPGGEPRVSDYLAGYFFGPDSVQTLNSYNRGMNSTIERWTPRVNGTQRPDVPVYILVGPGTASGAEDLAFIFKQTGRGILVGERTAGAGRLTRTYPIGDGFAASVPGGRTWDPRTGKEWERTGIMPDVAANGEDALVIAHSAALERLAAASTDAAWKQSLGWAREGILARAKPIKVADRLLASYAGNYDLRLVRLVNGKLFYHRSAERPGEELTPLSDTTFALGEASRVEFVPEGSRVVAMRVRTPDGQVSTIPRTVRPST